jgi:hypothetical protein
MCTFSSSDLNINEGNAMEQQTETPPIISQYLDPYAERKHALDFGEKRDYPDERLQYLHNYWTTERESTEHTGRAKREIDAILTRLAFELAQREIEQRQ